MVATLICGQQRRTGADVEDRALRAVSGLIGLGVGEGDIVAIMLRNDIRYVEAMLAARLAGVYACPINWHFKADEAGYILQDCAARVLIVHADLLAQIQGGIPDGTQIIAVEPSAEIRAAYRLEPSQCTVPASLLEWEHWLAEFPRYDGPPKRVCPPLPYSSGTSGRPKGILRVASSPEHIARMAATAREAIGIVPGMRTAMVAPIYHSAPAGYAMQSLLFGDLMLIEPRFDAEALLAAIERYRLDRLYLVPTHYVRLLRLPDEVKRHYDLSSIVFVASTGSPCPPAVKRAMVDWWGPVINEAYASSEAGYITLIAADEAMARPGSAGRPLPGAQLRILDDEGRPLPPLAPGLIYCRQESFPDFTYINRAADRAAMERSGLITVGDVGYLDDDGYLYICDRKSDMVISGGVNIYPAEIEAVLFTMPGVADCAVFGIPDAEFGEVLAAHVQPHEGESLDGDSVRSFLKERIADYKVPRTIEFARELPRDDSGKIFKRKLRDPYWREAGRTI
jgi:long-chain acyl-CoA synthetase